MTTSEKTELCYNHRKLLHILVHFGNYAMPLPLLRELCIELGIYPNEQSVNRAVRKLREAGILDRQTWVDNNSDLILARKFVRRYFFDLDSQGAATPPRPRTMKPYMMQARKAAWLLDFVRQYHLEGLNQVENILEGCYNTMFLRLPDLLPYFDKGRFLFASESEHHYQAQLEELRLNAARRSALAKGLLQDSPKFPVVTLEQTHQRGIYINMADPKEKNVWLSLFAEQTTKASRILDWVIDTYQWLLTLLSYCRAKFCVYALDAAHRDALQADLSRKVGSRTSYLESRLTAARMMGMVEVDVENTNFINCWCGGVRRRHF